jgi:hypothetical protein
MINYTASDLAGIFPEEQPRQVPPLRLPTERYEDEEGRQERIRRIAENQER